MKHDYDNPGSVIDALTRAQRTAGWNNRRPDVARFKLPNRCPERDPCTLVVVPAVAFTRNAERARDERIHGRCLWWDAWARDVGWCIGRRKPAPAISPRQHGGNAA